MWLVIYSYADVQMRHTACKSIKSGSFPHQHSHFTTSKIRISAHPHFTLGHQWLTWTIVIHCFMVWLTNCNFQRLQGIQNAAARLVTGTGRRQHITPLLRKLYTLPIRQRVEFMLMLLIHKSLLGQLPSYLADDCHLIADSSRRTLRSSDTATFVVRRTNSTFSDRSFAVTGARIWNSLPSFLRSADLSTERFKRALKTFLFVWDRGSTVTFLHKVINFRTYIHTYIHTTHHHLSYYDYLEDKRDNWWKVSWSFLKYYDADIELLSDCCGVQLCTVQIGEQAHKGSPITDISVVELLNLYADALWPCHRQRSRAALL